MAELQFPDSPIDQAYWERNQLLRILTHFWPSHLQPHEGDGQWDDDWRNVVCIHTPYGQATWHIHQRELRDFEHLAMTASHWDGHTTDEKYERLSHVGFRGSLRWRKDELGGLE